MHNALSNCFYFFFFDIAFFYFEARYSTTPGEKKKTRNKRRGESGIYESLENLQMKGDNLVFLLVKIKRKLNRNQRDVLLFLKSASTAALISFSHNYIKFYCKFIKFYSCSETVYDVLIKFFFSHLS